MIGVRVVSSEGITGRIERLSKWEALSLTKSRGLALQYLSSRGAAPYRQVPTPRL